MNRTRHEQNKNMMAVLTGTGIAVLICLVGTALIANLVLNERIDNKIVTAAVGVLLFVSAGLGGIAVNKVSDQVKWLPAVMGVCLIALIFLTGILIQGSIRPTIGTIGPIVAGAGSGWLLCLKKRERIKIRKKRYR